jgi:hypothetical protein
LHGLFAFQPGRLSWLNVTFAPTRPEAMPHGGYQMAFRFEMTFPDGELMVVFEEEENLKTGAFELATTFCDISVSHEDWREAEREALAAWSLALDGRRGFRIVRP